MTQESLLAYCSFCWFPTQGNIQKGLSKVLGLTFLMPREENIYALKPKSFTFLPSLDLALRSWVFRKTYFRDRANFAYFDKCLLETRPRPGRMTSLRGVLRPMNLYKISLLKYASLYTSGSRVLFSSSN